MARSIKPTLIMLSVIAAVLLLPIFALLYQAGELNVKSVALVLVLAPLGAVVLVLANINNSAKYGVLTNKQKKKDAEKYLDENDT